MRLDRTHNKNRKSRLKPSFSFGQLILSGVKDYLYLFSDAPHAKVLYVPFLDWLFAERQLKPRQRHYASRLLNKFIKDKLIELTTAGRLVLTEVGKRKLLNFEFNDFAIIKPKKWDGKFRVIIFDISVDKNRIRAAVRRQLIVWGFIRLQNSVWTHPYECREVISLLKEHFGVKNDVIYLTVESIENDRWLRKEFGLG